LIGGIDIGMAAAMISHIRASVQKAALVLLFLTAVTTPAWSQDDSGLPQGFAKQGGYVGFTGVPNFTFDGVTFDGETLYKEIDGEELAILPKLDKRNMMRFLLGYRYRQASLEVSYERVRHHGSFVDFPVDTTFQAINVDGRLFFLTRSRIQPHLLVGGAYPWLNVKDGSYLEPNVGDASWNGYGVNTEAGVTVYPHPRVGLSVGYSYRMLWFDRMKGVSDKLFYLRPRFKETSGSMVFSGMLTF
jgi:opacity protein-like surface antigen